MTTDLVVRPLTREQWLELAVEKLRPLFKEVDVELPRVRVSIGWPSKGGLKATGKVVGQCWKSTVAKDGVSQLFISPVLGEDQVQVLGILMHELVHASDDCESGHKGHFSKTARALGLKGKMTATVVEEDSELAERLAGFLEQLGDYPHSALDVFEVEKERTRTKQTTRMLKLECPCDGYIARTTAKWLDELGAPRCPCGMEMELA